MTCRVRIDRVGKSGAWGGHPRIYEARDEADAITIAAYEIDSAKPDRPRIATVMDARGRLLFTYSGRASMVSR